MTAMVRVATALRLVDVFTTALAGDPCRVLGHTPTDAPGDTVPREWVGLADMSGDLELVSTRGGSTTSYRDDFEVDFEVQITNPSTPTAGVARCGVIVQALIDALRADPGLTTPTAIDGLAFVQLGSVRGPRYLPLAEGTGYGARALLTFNGRAHKLGA